MATTPLMSKKLASLTCDGSVLAFITGWSFGAQREFFELETLAFENAGTQYVVPTGKKYSFSFDGVVPLSSGVTGGDKTYWDLLTNITNTDSSLYFQTIPDVSTQKYIGFSCYLANLTQEVAGKAAVTFKAELQPIGNIIIGTTV